VWLEITNRRRISLARSPRSGVEHKGREEEDGEEGKKPVV
jgi:hypothetical protein